MANTFWSTIDKSANVTLTGSNLIATASGAAAWVRASDRQVTGKFYWECKPTVWGSGNTGCGFCTGTVTPPDSNSTAAFTVFKSGNIWIAGAASGSTLSARLANDVIGIAVDLAAGLAWARVAPAGNWNGSGTANPATGAGGLSIAAVASGGIPAYPHAIMGANLESITANFGDSAFTGTVPSGFTSGFPLGAPPLNEIVTQVGVEEWGSSNPVMQATQVGVEEWGTSANPAAVTQVSAEHWAAASPDAAVTQALVEHWGTVSTISTQAVVTQVAVEHWITEAAVSTARPRRVVCVSG